MRTSKTGPRLIVGLAVLALGLYAYAAYAGCGGCGAAAPAAGKTLKAAKSCGAGCTKACCAKKGAAKKCGAGCTKACCAAKKAAAPTLSAATLKVLLNAKVPVVLLDARAGGKWDDGRRLPGAKPLAPNATAQQAAAAIGSTDALVVTYCGSPKCPLSHRLFDRLKGLGYKNLLEYPEGIAGWFGPAAKANVPARPKASLPKASAPTGCGTSCGASL